MGFGVAAFVLSLQNMSEQITIYYWQVNARASFSIAVCEWAQIP